QRPALEPLLRRVFAAGPVGTTLNAGAGEGLYAPLIRQFAGGARHFEFDFSPLRRSADADTHRFQASLAAIPLRDGSVDLAVCTEVLEHVADDESAVAELRRVLSPSGTLILSVPTPPAVFDPAHVREGYTLDQLRDLFSRHDLEIVDARFSMHRLFQLLLK